MRLAALLLLLLISLDGAGQGMPRLYLDFRGGQPEDFLSDLRNTRTYPDSLRLRHGLDSIMAQLQSRGYFEAQILDLKADSSGYLATIEPGPMFEWHLQNENISDEAIRMEKVSRYFEGVALPFSLFEELQKKVIGWYEDHGYPFASLRPEGITIEGNKLIARLKVETSHLIVYDTLQLSGDIRLSSGFLAAHTGIRPGQAYSETRTRNAPGLISELPFLQLSGDPSMQFSPGSARLIIPVKKRPANRFDGIAGFSSNTLDESRLQITGQLNLSLVNLMARGEKFSMVWQGLGQGTQRLTLDASYPYLLSTPFITSWLFSLHKQDTSYLNLRNRPAFTWTSPKRIHLSIFADLHSTQLLSTSRFSDNTTLPSLIDSKTYLYGLEAAFFSDGFFSGLMDGQGLSLSFAAGTRNIQKNANLPEALYEGVILSQNKYSLGLEAEARLPLGRRIRLVIQMNSRGLSGQQFFENELFRIGGFSSLKGFDEEAILASFYGILGGELRYFTGERSYFSLLYNGAYFERRLQEDFFSGWPWGAAAGITLETAPGIISVFYAIGKGPETPLAFRNAKVHIGFISLF